MAKKPASTSLEEALYERVERIALVDRRSIAEVIAWAAEKGLPLVEEEMANRAKLFAGPAPFTSSESRSAKRKKRAA